MQESLVLISSCFYFKTNLKYASLDTISKMETTPVISKIKIHVSMKENRLMPSRFGNCQKQTAPHGNSNIQTQAATRRGFVPSGVSVCFGLAVTLRRIKCCFVAAVSCPSPCSPLCILCTVQHVEGEIKVKATYGELQRWDTACKRS